MFWIQNQTMERRRNQKFRMIPVKPTIYIPTYPLCNRRGHRARMRRLLGCCRRRKSRQWKTCSCGGSQRMRSSSFEAKSWKNWYRRASFCKPYAANQSWSTSNLWSNCPETCCAVPTLRRCWSLSVFGWTKGEIRRRGIWEKGEHEDGVEKGIRMKTWSLSWHSCRPQRKLVFTLCWGQPLIWLFFTWYSCTVLSE